MKLMHSGTNMDLDIDDTEISTHPYVCSSPDCPDLSTEQDDPATNRTIKGIRRRCLICGWIDLCSKCKDANFDTLRSTHRYKDYKNTTPEEEHWHCEHENCEGPENGEPGDDFRGPGWFHEDEGVLYRNRCKRNGPLRQLDVQGRFITRIGSPNASFYYPTLLERLCRFDFARRKSANVCVHCGDAGHITNQCASDFRPAPQPILED